MKHYFSISRLTPARRQASLAERLLCVGLLFLFCFQGLVGQDLIITPANTSVTDPLPANFSLMVEVSESPVPIDGVSLRLEFDPSLVQVVEIAPRSNFFQIIPPTIDNTLGTISYDIGLFSGFPSGSFPLAEISLQAVAPGASTVDIIATGNDPSIVASVGEDVLQDVMGATIEIGAQETPQADLIITPDNSSLTDPLPADFTLTVEVSESSVPVDGVSLGLAFDPTLVQIVEVAPLSGFFQIVDPVIDNDAGTLAYDIGLFGNFPSGSFPLASVTFQAVGQGDANINFITTGNSPTIVASAGADILRNTTGATVAIGPPDIECTVDANADDTPKQLDCSTGSVMLSGQTSTGTYSWSGPGGYTSTQQNPTVTVAGEYILTTTTYGCSDTDEVTVLEAEQPQTYYADIDEDGFGDPNARAQLCSPQDGFVIDNTDCDDGNATVYPGAPELCDGLDNDCNDSIDDGITNTTFYADTDGDGLGDPNNSVEDCSVPDGFVTNDDDCDDTDATIGAEMTFYADTDGDGFGDANTTTMACVSPDGFVVDNTDCDDSNATVYPGAPELCDGLDNDCNGSIDDGITNTTFYADTDGDGLGDPNSSVEDCSVPDGFVNNDDDCDDTDATIGAEMTFYADTDNDGFGDANSSTMACAAPDGFVVDNTDCDDSNATVYPGAPELCDGLDNDCNGSIDDGITNTTFYADTDGDGLGDPNSSVEDCSVPDGFVNNNDDCDDTDAAIGAEITFYADTDGDGFGDANTTTMACVAPDGFVTDNTDCDDSNATVYPGAPELCDGLDNDCNGSIDDGQDCGGDNTETAFWLEAECATVGSNWKTVANGNASNGNHVVFPHGNAMDAPPADVAANRIRFTVANAEAGHYNLFVRIGAPSGLDDSFWVRINGGDWYKWFSGITRTSGAGLAWNRYPGPQVSLPAGTSTIDFAYREDGTLLDKLYLGKGATLPSGIGQTATNCGPTDPTNQPPLAVAKASPNSGTAPLSVQLDGSKSSDPDGQIVSYDWAWNGGSATGVMPIATFSEGNYTVTLTVTDDKGAKATDVVSVSATAPTTGTSTFWLEAECAAVGQGWEVVANANASKGSHVVFPHGNSMSVPPADVPANRIRFSVPNAEAGHYALFARIGAPSGLDDSFWVRINGGEWYKWASGMTRTSGTALAWNRYPGPQISLPAGNSTIDFAYREDGTLLDKLYLSKNASRPTGTGQPASNCAPTPPTTTDKLWLEAECAMVGSQWTTETTAAASNGEYVVVLSGNSNNDPPADIAANRVRFTVTNAKPGSYHLFARIDAPTNLDDSYWVRINGSDWFKWNSGIKQGTGFSWNKYPAGSFSLRAGSNTIDFAFREDGTRLDKLHLNKTGIRPTGMGRQAINCGDGAPDSDNDGVVDSEDNCPTVPNPDQTLGTFYADFDGDGFGDPDDFVTACKAPTNYVDNDMDNCPSVNSDDLSDSDGDGIGDVCDTTPEPTTASSWLEAECGTLSSGWAITSSSAASRGLQIQFVGLNRTAAPPVNEPAQEARFNVTLNKAGTYHLFARLNARTLGTNSVWVRIDQGPWMKFWVAVGGGDLLTNGLEWRKVNDDGTDRSFQLTAGNHTITVANRESGTILDKLALTTTATAPIGEGEAATNCSSTASREMSGFGFVEQDQPQQVEQPTLELFPNPVADELTLSFRSMLTGTVDVLITDATGRTLQTLHLEKASRELRHELRVSSLPPGVYRLRVIEEDRQSVRPFIKM